MQNRIERVIENMKKMGLSQLMVADPMSIRYLTGIYVEPYERLFAFLARATTGSTGTAGPTAG